MLECFAGLDLGERFDAGARKLRTEPPHMLDLPDKGDADIVNLGFDCDVQKGDVALEIEGDIAVNATNVNSLAGAEFRLHILAFDRRDLEADGAVSRRDHVALVQALVERAVGEVLGFEDEFLSGGQQDGLIDVIGSISCFPEGQGGSRCPAANRA